MWSEEERLLLDLVLNELIPPSDDGRIPGAGDVGVAEFFAEAERYVGDPVARVKIVLTGISNRAEDFSRLSRGERTTVIREVEATESKAFSALIRLAYMGYYSRSDIRPFFGLSSRPAHPDGYQVVREDEALISELTAPVRARGSIYRPS